MKKVAVLMCTYNGERYLIEQVESLFSQEQVEVSIFVRDDGSTDSTMEILQRYQDSIFIIDNEGKNVGVGNSFMTVLYEVGTEYDYYAFCDQDDVWQQEKLIKAIEKISAFETPTLYCSNQTLVNQDLDLIGLRNAEEVDVSYRQILTKNKVSGCTMVWNNKLQNILTEKKRRPTSDLLKIRIHDVWISMVASTVGKVIYDQNSYIYYRQHESNVVGVKGNKRKTLVAWYNKLVDKSNRYGRSLLAQEIVNKFGDIAKTQIISELRVLASYRNSFKNKIRLLKDKHLFSLSTESKLAIKLKILFNFI